MKYIRFQNHLLARGVIVDKYENKVKIEEIRSLIIKGQYEKAVDIADTVNWATVKNIPTLGMASDLYKKMHLFEESRKVLLYAYERQKSRPVIKSLCELSIELGDLINAIKFFNEFKEIASKDPGRYILQYRIYKAQNINIDEQIEVLEELKQHDYTAKWAYELAELYHKAGNETKCVEECEGIILWFVDGKYVLKAYELKALHQPLTEQENYRYEVLRQAGGELNIQASLKETERPVQKPKKFEVDSDLGECNTQNLQAVVAEGLQDVFEEPKAYVPKAEEPARQISKPASYEEAVAMDEEVIRVAPPETNADLQVTTMYNPVLPEEPVGQELERPEINNAQEDKNFSDTDIIGDVAKAMAATMLNEKVGMVVPTENPEPEIPEPKYVLNTDTDEIKPITGPIPEIPIHERKKEDKPLVKEPTISYEAKPTANLSNTGIIEKFHKGSNMDDMLSQGYDGQISLVVPEEKPVERQITGQISIDDVMKEWEERKKETEKKLVSDIKRKVEQQTAALLAGFENEATRNSLLAQIESAIVNAALEQEKEKIAAGRPKEIKVADIEALDHTGEIATKIIEEALAEDEANKPTEKAVVPKTPVTPEFKPLTAPKIEMPEEKADDGVEEIEEIEEVPEIEETEETESMETAQADDFEDAEDDFDDFEDAEQEEIEEAYEESVHRPRQLSEAEKSMFSAFIHHRSTQKQLAFVLDNVTLASYTGNILVSSEEDNEVTTFSKLLIQDIQQSDSNFTGKVAMISGESLNRKDIAEVFDKVRNGALIISAPEQLVKKTVDSLERELEKDGLGVVVIIQGHADVLDKFVAHNEGIKDIFNLRIDLKAFDDKTLVEYAKSYAYDNEYSLDELGVLALHTRIADMQTSDHEVTMAEIEELIDEAIYYADKKTIGHFFDILFGKRYDDEDMIVLREKDFMHY